MLQQYGVPPTVVLQQQQQQQGQTSSYSQAQHAQVGLASVRHALPHRFLNMLVAADNDNSPHGCAHAHLHAHKPIMYAYDHIACCLVLPRSAIHASWALACCTQP